MVFESIRIHHDGWHSSFRSAVRGAVFPDERHLAEAVLLSFWISVPCFPDPYYICLHHQHRHGIFSVMRRGKNTCIFDTMKTELNVQGVYLLKALQIDIYFQAKRHLFPEKCVQRVYSG